VWYQQDRAARRAEAAARQARAEAEATAALGQAEAHLQDNLGLRDRNPERWDAAVRLAGAAVARAEAAVTGADVDAPLADRVGHARERVDREGRDSGLRLELDRTRLEMAATTRGHFDASRAVRRYREVLGRYGIDPGAAVAPGSAADGGLREAVVAALADWARLTPDPPERRRLEALLEAAGGAGGWRARWRAAVRARDGKALAALAGEAVTAADVANLARDLCELKQLEAAVGLLRRGRQRFPDDFWLNHDLGAALCARDRRSGDGVPYLMVAVALRPQSAGAHNNLGNALRDKGDADAADCYRRALALDPGLAAAHTNLGDVLRERGDLAGAVRCHQRALKLEPTYALAHTNLGRALQDQGDVDGAVRCHTRAVELEPQFAPAHNNLGMALYARGNRDGAGHCFRRALEIDPGLAEAHTNLGVVLADRGDVDVAVPCHRRALELEPQLAPAHNNLGLALYARGDLDGAVRCFQKALALDPRYAAAHSNLGHALLARGDAEGAARCYRRALELQPGNAKTHTNLGNALATRGDLDGAVRCFQRALELDPRFDLAHCALGQALLLRGDFARAREATRRCLDLLPAGHPLRDAATAQLRQCEDALALVAKLPAVLRGEARPADAAEALALARLCQQSRQQYAAAVRLYRDAFVAAPKLADDPAAQHRYNAACSAALAASGRGRDTGALADRERAALRRQALAWLRADLNAWGKRLADAAPPQRQEVLKTLQHWQQDTDLAGVRDDKALAALPTDERAAWKKLWADVAELARQAQGEK
jgi:tetratricopeptide (TPR) repeat protein